MAKQYIVDFYFISENIECQDSFNFGVPWISGTALVALKSRYGWVCAPEWYTEVNLWRSVELLKAFHLFRILLLLIFFSLIMVYWFVLLYFLIMASNLKGRGSQATPAEISLIHLKNCLVNLPSSLSSLLVNINAVSRNEFTLWADTHIP